MNSTSSVLDQTTATDEPIVLSRKTSTCAGVCAATLLVALMLAFVIFFLVGALQKASLVHRATSHSGYRPRKGDVLYREFWDAGLKFMGMHCGLLGGRCKNVAPFSCGDSSEDFEERWVYHVFRDTFGSRGIFLKQRLSDFLGCRERGVTPSKEFYVVHLPESMRRDRADAIRRADKLVGSVVRCDVFSLSANCETPVLALACRDAHAVSSHQVLRGLYLARRLGARFFDTALRALTGEDLGKGLLFGTNHEFGYPLTKHPGICPLVGPSTARPSGALWP